VERMQGSCTFNDVNDVRSVYGSPLWAENLSDLPSTYDILSGNMRFSRAEERLFMR